MNAETIPRLRAGTSGLVLPVPNKQAFPEAFRVMAARLTYYSTLFNSIEINSTFYKMPLPKTFSRWAGEVQPDFRFTIKLWRGITHVPGLQVHKEDVYRCPPRRCGLGNKKGSLLIQLPPGLGRSTPPRNSWSCCWRPCPVPIRTGRGNRRWNSAIAPGIPRQSIPSWPVTTPAGFCMTCPHPPSRNSRTTIRALPFICVSTARAGDYKGGYSRMPISMPGQTGLPDGCPNKKTYMYILIIPSGMPSPISPGPVNIDPWIMPCLLPTPLAAAVTR